ncbi:protein translocase subunit SecD [Francisellaceae bacterium]|nr:protein translocase subunit SecD [Francisellaceae bacterium]
MYTRPGGQAPINQYPLWRNLFILFIVIIAVLYSLPNAFGETPSIQLSPKGGSEVSEQTVQKTKDVLKQYNIKYHNLEVGKYNISMLFDSVGEQTNAQTELSDAFGNDMTVALNLSPNTPDWLRAIGAGPMNYGLDLRGGMYFVLEADTDSAIKNNLDNFASEIRTQLREEKIRYSGVDVISGKVVIEFNNRSQDIIDKAESYLRSHFPQLLVTTQNSKGVEQVSLALNNQEVDQIRDSALTQVVEVMRNRVNELGVAEASVTKSNNNRVIIELPGVQDSARAKQILGGTATVQFQLVNQDASLQAAESGNVPIGSSLYNFANGQPLVLYNRIVLSGSAIVGAIATPDPQTQLPSVSIKLSGPEVSYFSKVTGENIGKQLAAVLVQTNFDKKMVNGKEITVPSVSKQIINAATIQSRLGNSFQITGLQMREAQNVALMIRSGALPTPVQIVEEQTIGPTLGAENIKMGAISIAVALALVVIFMFLYYGLLGLVADIALVLNLFFIVGVMSIIPGATLTLPGIAGIVLNLGMAIDGNVLIFERIREELRNGMTPQAAIHAGYQRAFSTIVDSNITTLIVAIILFAIGTGAVKGFAVTLMIGIVTSMFTAITVTRAMVNFIYGKRRQLKWISIGIRKGRV